MAKQTLMQAGTSDISFQYIKGAGPTTFSKLDLIAFSIFSESGSVTTDLMYNYGQFMINKMLVVVDQISVDSYYWDGTSGAHVDPNVSRMYLRYLFVDGNRVTGVPSLAYDKSEYCREKKVKFANTLKLKKWFYFRCKKSITTSVANMKMNMIAMLTAMEAQVKLPTLFLGWGPYVVSKIDKYEIGINYRIRCYVYVTYSAKKFDVSYGFGNKV